MLIQRGLSLIEMLVTLLLMSIILVFSGSLLPALIGQYAKLYQLYQLEQLIDPLLFRLEKELRRAGFIYGETFTKPVLLQSDQNHNTYCLIIRYDLNHNGKIESFNSLHSEWFAYRFEQGILAMKRGTNHCGGSGWQKLIDPNQLIITKWRVTLSNSIQHHAYFLIEIQAHWAADQHVSKQITRLVSAVNL